METCRNNHTRTDENTYITKQGKRQCRECHRINQLKRGQSLDIKLQNRARVAAWKKANPERYIMLRKQAKKAYRERFNALKPQCNKCPETHPACLEFHHRDPSTKLFNIGEDYGKHSWKSILAEVAKCDVLCSNCHRKLHWEMRQKDKQ